MSNLTKVRKYKTFQIPDLGIWHIEFLFYNAWWGGRGTYHLSIGFFKLLSYPPVGEMFQSKHYEGFWFKHDFNFYPQLGFAVNLKRSK